MAENINRCLFSGNLTRDPELRDAGSTKVCNMRLAVNSRVKRDGEWGDKPNYLDIAVFGRQGENCHQYLSRGSGVIVDCRVDWREWQQDDGTKRQAVQFIADNVQFLSSGSGSDQEIATPVGGGNVTDEPLPDFAPAPSTAPADDDIPF